MSDFNNPDDLPRCEYHNIRIWLINNTEGETIIDLDINGSFYKRVTFYLLNKEDATMFKLSKWGKHLYQI